MYKKKWNKFTPFNVAVFDIETNMFSKEEETIVASLSYKDKMITTIKRDWIGNIPDLENKLRKKFDFYLGDMRIGKNKPKDGEEDKRPIVGERIKEWEIVVCDTAGECIKKCFDKAHEWSPDIIAIWNIDFDLPHCVRDLERDGLDPKDVFCDPWVPAHLRHFKYNQGKAFRAKKGKDMPLKPAQRWHWVDCPASFWFVDAMQAYYIIRIAQADKPSYALDYILDLELGARKLKFTELDDVSASSKEWHEKMQAKWKLEYIIYNTFDVISVEYVDEKTFDLAVSMPGGCGISHFKDFNSQPRREWDEIQTFLLERGMVGGNGKGIRKPTDDLQISTDDWINTLPAHMMPLTRSVFYEETNLLYTKIRTHCADLDITSAYPSNTVALNISQSTTVSELIDIQGVCELVRRNEGLNMSGGPTNAIGVMTNLFGCPQLDELSDMFAEEMKSSDEALVA